MAPVSTDKRAAILKAGQKAVERYGYEKTTLDDIAQICGIVKSSIYYYFDNKEDLFNEIFTREAAKFVALFEEHAARAPGPSEAILAYIKCRKIFATQNRSLSDVAIHTFMEVQPIALQYIQDIRDKCIQIMEGYIKEGIEQHVFSKDINVREIAESIEVISRSIELDEVHNSGVKNFSEVNHQVIADKSERVVRLILNGIRT